MTTWIRNNSDPAQLTCTLDVTSQVDGSFAPTTTSLAGKLYYRAGGTSFAPAAGTLTNTGYPGKWQYQAPQAESNVDSNEIEYMIVDSVWYAQTLVEILQTAQPASPVLTPGGPNYVVSDLIARARAYIGDDNNETPGWTADSTWIAWLNAEYSILYKRWIRNSLVRPKPTETTFAGNVTLSGVLCVVGVADASSPGIAPGQVRVLRNAMVEQGADPFWTNPNAPYPAMATSWAVHGLSDELTLELDAPNDPIVYTVRWIPSPGAASATTDQIALPAGGDERLVLGIARRATIKDGARLMLLEQLLQEHDAEDTFTATARAGGFAAKRRRIHHLRRFSDNPRDWYFL